MKSITRYIPNTITCFNLASGSIATLFAFEGQLIWASWFIILASVFDFLDGFAARMLKAYSPMGKELDSLADIVSFGVAPAMILYTLLKITLFESFTLPPFDELCWCKIVILFSPILIIIFSGLRLAKFNVDDRQTESFMGLAVPANALFFASIPFIVIDQHNNWILNVYLLIPAIFLHSFLLVSEIPMFSLKVKSLAWKGNETRYLFLIYSAAVFGYLGMMGLGLIIWGYILFSVISNLVYRINS